MRFKGKILRIWLILLVTAPFSFSAKKNRPASYHLETRIEPDSGEIYVDGTFKVILGTQNQKNFDFNLHGTFRVEKIRVNGRSVEFCLERNAPWMIIPSSQKVTVAIPVDCHKEILDVEIVYHGKLEEIPEFGTFEDQEWALDDRINPRMIELANYSCWYPQFSFGIRFETDLLLSLPNGWKCVCSGEKTAEWKKDGRMLSRWVSPSDTDIIIVASPHLKNKTFEGDEIKIEIYHSQMPDDFIKNEIQQIKKILNLFNDLIGQTVIPAGTVKHVFSPKRKGQGGAGIARPGMIVTSEGRTLEGLKNDPDFSLFHGIAHEIAHFWWNFGSGQGDWINETFAEYFALIAVQRITSWERFKFDLEKYRELVKGLPGDAPPLSSVPFAEGRTNYIVRYYKGALMLDDIRNLIGNRRFFRICREFFQTYNNTIIHTPEFRQFWGERLGREKKVLDTWLDARGGLADKKGINHDNTSNDLDRPAEHR